MNELMNFKNKPQEKEEEEEYTLREAAQKVGLEVDLPEENEPVYKRIIQQCREYMNMVDKGDDPRKILRDKYFGESNEKRIKIHDKLCVMLCGRVVSGNERRKVSNFAALVADKEDYLNTF